MKPMTVQNNQPLWPCSSIFQLNILVDMLLQAPKKN